MKFAVQLYSLRELTAARGLKESLRVAKSAGFDGVEFAGFGDLTPAEAKDELNALGLEAMGAHVSLAELAAQGEALFACLGLPTMTVPYLAESEREFAGASLRSLVETFAGRCDLCYHNHDFEFRGGGNLVRTLLDEVPGLGWEADIFWLKAAGLDPVAELERAGERVRLLHVKEHAPDGSCPVVGEGDADCAGALAFGVRQNLSWAVLEAEQFAGDPEPYLAACCAEMRRLAR